MQIDHQWIPNIRFGPFVFGQTLPQHIEISHFPSVDETFEWKEYRMNDEQICLSISGGKVVSVESWERVLFNGIDIIGCVAEQLQNVLGQSVVFRDDYLACDSLGMMAWADNGFIESVSMSRQE